METRAYQPRDETKILELFQLSFGKALSPAYWKWRFLDNPENKVMIMLKWDGDVLAGHYAVSPVRMQVEGSEVLTALSMTTMTHPSYAGRGIFTELAENLYEEERLKNQLAAVWGFPNNNSHYGFIKNVGWKNLEQIPTFSIDAAKIKELTSDVRVMSTLENIELWMASSDNYSVSIKKDSAYLDWRYTQNPANDYVIFGLKKSGKTQFAIVKLFRSFNDSTKHEIDICEWEVEADSATQQQFLSAIKTHFDAYDILQMNMWLPMNDPKHIILEKEGFRNLAPITYSGVRLLDSTKNTLTQSAAWHYSLGYSDIY